MSCGVRERRHIPWFFSWFSLVVLTCLFAVFLFMDSHLVWDPLSEPIPKWGTAIFDCLHIVLPSVPSRLYLVTTLPTNLSCLLTYAWCQREDVSVSCVPTPAQKIWDLRFLLVSFNQRSHSSVTGWAGTSTLPFGQTNRRSAGRS